MREGKAKGPMFSRKVDGAAASRQSEKTERAYGGRAAYDRAKAAGKTKLTYGQWVQVRTPNFKAWFGDWEGARALDGLTAMDAIQVSPLPSDLAGAELREKAKSTYEAAAKQGPITTTDGRDIALTGIGFKKTKFHSADRRVLDLLGSIREVIGGAAHISSIEHTPESPSDSIRAWHYYGAKVQLNGAELFAKLVLRESVNGQIYYDNDLSSLEEISGRTGDATQNKPGAAAVSADRRTLSQLLAYGNPNAASKAVDPDTGEPLVVYHGTVADFAEFDGANPDIRFSRADPYADYLSLSYNPKRRPKHRPRQSATALRVCTRRGRSVRCG